VVKDINDAPMPTFRERTQPPKPILANNVKTPTRKPPVEAYRAAARKGAEDISLGASGCNTSPIDIEPTTEIIKPQAATTVKPITQLKIRFEELKPNNVAKKVAAKPPKNVDKKAICFDISRM